MKYIGNKTRLLDFIEDSISKAEIPLEGTFCDLFSGTGSVGYFFKKKGMRVISNDIMTYSYVLQKVMIELNSTPDFGGLKVKLKLDSGCSLEELLATISVMTEKAGYFHNNFSPSGDFKRQFFTDENGLKIGAIRDALSIWRTENVIDDVEFNYLLASLINAADHVANMSGTYGAYLKIWRTVALKPLKLLPIETFDNSNSNSANSEVAEELITKISGDILYLDPPYNSRQYASNFHVLETLAVWDKQELRGVAGLRDYETQKSAFSSKKLATNAFKSIIEKANFKYIVLSYNNEGIIPREQIVGILGERGKISEFTTDYRRFRTESDHEGRQYKQVGDRVTEHLWLVECK
jgi:adenine-specific DNA-methyltransferase